MPNKQKKANIIETENPPYVNEAEEKKHDILKTEKSGNIKIYKDETIEIKPIITKDIPSLNLLPQKIRVDNGKSLTKGLNNDREIIEPNVLENMIREYLGNNRDDSPWVIKKSPLSGRGVFATKDLQPGDIVFRDIPLVLGPRAGSSCPLVCVGCHKGNSSFLNPCSKGCGLPVCSIACESTSRHRPECQLLLCPGRVGYSDRLLRAVTPIRCLLLSEEQKKLLLCLQAHHHSKHAFEMEYIKNEISLSPEEERFLIQACCTLDSNAFRANISLRALYPLGSLLNHQCTPNTRHGYDSEYRLVVRAAVYIPAGTEITNSYTPLLWSTQARRHSLAFSKYFACSCPRCQDPQEMGTRLGALLCARDGCSGSLLSQDPLRSSSKWKCDVCDVTLPGRQAAVVQSTLANLMGSIDQKDPEQVAKFLEKQRGVLPPTNQIVVDMKSTLVALYGHSTGYSWTELTDEMLEHKEVFCRELLQLVQRLGAGQCKLRGIFLYELHCTLVEKLRRKAVKTSSSQHMIQDVSREAVEAIQEAAEIFQEDEASPIDIWCRLEEATKANP